MNFARREGQGFPWRNRCSCDLIESRMEVAMTRIAICLCGSLTLPQTALMLVLGLSTILLGCITASAQPAHLSHWQVSEFQPDISPGGRVNTIAVHPINNAIILVASESGGLFRSGDAGQTWHHVNAFPVLWTNAVAFMPANPNIV